MENSLSLPAPSTAHCAACNTEILTDDAFCTNCGYPIKGTEFEQKNFIAMREIVDIDLADYNKKVKKAGNTLYYISIIFIVAAIIYLAMNKNDHSVTAVVVTNLVLAAVFLVLGGFSRKKPLACIVSGLSLYVIVQILNLIADPSTIAKGIVVKIFIIGFLVKGIKSAIELEKIKKENNIV